MVLAWVVPGAGHLYLRKPVRGLVIFFAIGLTFWAGIAMGGAMTLYSEGDAWWWFAADMLTGAHGMVALKVHQREFEPALAEAKSRFAKEGYARLSDSQQENEAYQQLIAQELEKRRLALVSPGDTVARAYSGVAGLLNLLCVFDALMLGLMGRVGEPPPESPQPPTKPQVLAKPPPPPQDAGPEDPAPAAPARPPAQVPADARAQAPREDAS
jgi:hypothetical protein